MEWGLELLQEPERCFLELQHARAAYRPGLGSFQWEVLATTRSERTDAELRVGSEPLLVATEVPQRSEELRVLGQVTTDSLPPDNIDVVIYLSFRGTVSQENMITNLKAELVPLTLGASAQGQVHRGFQDAYLALRPRLLTKLDEVTADPSLLPARVLVRATGHSLGGVLAMLACYDLRSCRGVTCECVTWGAPRLGDGGFAELWNAAGIKLERLVNRFDVVPRLPSNQEDEAGEQGRVAAQLHQWLGRVQAARNALGYVHFCDSVERGLWRVNESVSVSTCSFTRMHQKGSPTSTVTNDVSHVPQSHMCGAEPHAWLGGSVQDLDTSAAAAALHWANAAKVAALS
ncbi:unnamed protein product, partial [Durusdinium trenchii]